MPQVTVGLVVKLTAKPETADEVAGFLTDALALANDESGTPVWMSLRTDATTRPRYEARGSTGFDWSGGVEPPSETYFAVPSEVYDDPPTPSARRTWADRSPRP